MTGHVYRLTVEFTIKSGLTADDRALIAQKVSQQISQHGFPKEVAIEHVDYVRDEKDR
jgi:hypothetical protein